MNIRKRAMTSTSTAANTAIKPLTAMQKAVSDALQV